MVKEKKKPYGYIYKVTNSVNEKVYIGKTTKTIEERWGKHLKKARALERAREANPQKKIYGTHINNAINKYGSNAFVKNQEDIAYSRAELNEKERYWVKEYDSMNPDKGYNMTEGGEGGKPSPEVIKKMTEANQEIGRNPETQEKISEAISKKWQDQQYQENVSKGVTDKWQEAKYRERQFISRTEGKREISDKREFLKDIQEMKKEDLNTKYDMDGKSINDRIEEMLGHQGVKNYSEAKKYLEKKNLDEVVKDINVRLNEQPKEFTGKKVISNKREFLEDIQNMQAKEIAQKYDMNRTTVNKRIREMLGEHGVKNYTEAKNYLEGKNLDDVVKGINEKLKDQSHITEGKTIISDKKEFLKDIQELQKNEIDQKYGMDAKTVNNKIKEMLGEHGVKNYTGAKEYLKDKNVDDVLKDIDNRSGERQDSSSENTNEENKEEARGDSKQKEDEDENQSEEKGKDINDKESEESTEEIPEKDPDEDIGEQKEDVSAEENSEREEVQNDNMKSEKKLETKSMREPGYKIVHVPETPRGCQRSIPQGGDNDNRGQKTKEKRDKKEEIRRFTLTSGVEQRQPVQRSSKDYDGINESPDDKRRDYDGIDTHSDNDKSDIKTLDGGFNEQGNDYDGIDNPQEDGDKDYDKIDDGYYDGGSEGEGAP